MIYPETQTQIAILEWLAWQFPEVRKHVIKIDNEGVRSKAGLFVSIRAGLYTKAADLFLCYPMDNYHGAFLEVKRDGYVPKSRKEKEHMGAQLEFLAQRRVMGYFAEMAIGVDQGINALKTYLHNY